MSKMVQTFGLMGAFGLKRFEAREVLREVERGDPMGEAFARKSALARAIAEGLPFDFELVDETEGPNTVSNEWYDLILDTMLKGDAYTDNVRMSVFGNDVTPGATLTITTFEASLGEATGYTVDGGNTTNRSTTTFAAASSQSITNSASPSRFTFTGADTIYGAFLTQGATLKNGTQDTPPAVYIAGAKFAASQVVASSSIIDVVYTQSKA